MKLFGFLIIFILLICCEKQPRYRPSREVLETEARINTILKSVALQMRSEKGLIPSGNKGRTSNGVEMLGLSFNLRKHVTIDEGRELMVRVVEQLVSEINEDEKLQSHLVFKPFEPRNVEVQIFLWKSKGAAPDPGELFIIEARDGVITFLTEDKKSEPFRVVHKETFEEALGYLEKKNSQNDLYKKASKRNATPSKFSMGW